MMHSRAVLAQGTAESFPSLTGGTREANISSSPSIPAASSAQPSCAVKQQDSWERLRSPTCELLSEVPHLISFFVCGMCLMAFSCIEIRYGAWL